MVHYIDYNNKIIINVTRGDHLLRPGLVVRYLYKDNNDYKIRTIGFGNGFDPLELNEKLSNPIWESNVNRISIGSIYDDTIAHHPTKASSVGDPHETSFPDRYGRRLSSDIQRPGEYVLTKGTGINDTFEIQVRHELFRDSRSVSVNTAVATKLGNETVALYVPPKVAGQVTGTELV